MKLAWTLLGFFAVFSNSEPAELKVFFGNLHSHTSYSDGSGTPDMAYQYARDQAKIDFLALTEHNHRSAEGSAVEKNNDSIAHHPVLYNGSQPTSLLNAAKRHTVPGKFVALYGQEFSTISHGNHVNVFEIGEVIDENVVKNRNFAQLFAWLQTHQDSQGLDAIIQFNHPETAQRDSEEEYGADDFGSTEEWKAKVGRHTRLISIQNGPSHTPATNQPAKLDTVDDYLAYLSLGFKLGPTCDQDNHYKNWGATTAARTAIVTDELTKPKVLEALRKRHVYATQDKNLRVVFLVEKHLCGDAIETSSSPNSDLKIEYSIVDDDEPDATYRIEIWGGQVGGTVAQRLFPALSSEGNNSLQQLKQIDEIPYPPAGSYVLFKVIQEGEHHNDDVVWTAPVWIEQLVQPDGTPAVPPATESFVASTRSPVYHLAAECRAARKIAPVNRISGAAAKNGRVPHKDCPLL